MRREGQLPLRERRGPPLAGDPHVLEAEPGTLGDLAGRVDRARHRSDRAIPPGASPARGAGQRVTRRSVEVGHERRLVTIFGEVQLRRLAYRRKGATNLYPADAALNVPAEMYSHALRALAATEAARGSFDEAVAAIGRASAAVIASARSRP